MPSEQEKFEDRLHKLCERIFAAPPQGLARLSGGASQESWVFTIGTARYVLRRTPHGLADTNNGARLPLAHEARILQAVAHNGLKVPEVPYICEADDALGPAYIMAFIEGETIARKILRDDAFAEIRPQLASQCGETLARLHQTDIASLPDLPYSDAAGELATYKGFLRTQEHPHPVFELAIQWLEAHVPPAPRTPTLVHGDFRNGNLIISPQAGVRAVLDWELAHIGDPMEDLGWMCVPSWRFGVFANPVGGFGTRAQFYDAYRAAGGEVNEETARFWEILGTLKWGIMCSVLMVNAFETGRDISVERAAIGRRASETEIDLLRMLLEKD